jgi:xylulose-5-phosphate/fructose-6-phosphate phosphoketolase
MLSISAPWARPAVIANSYLEFYPNVAQNIEGMKQLFTQFCFAGGI